jgi:hypothetical protein
VKHLVYTVFNLETLDWKGTLCRLRNVFQDNTSISVNVKGIQIWELDMG